MGDAGGRFCGASLLGLSGKDSSPPTAPRQRPFPSSPQVGPHPPTHTHSSPGTGLKRDDPQTAGAPSPSPPPASKVTSFLASPGHRDKRRPQTQGGPAVGVQRVRQEGPGSHALAEPPPVLFRVSPLCVCLFLCLKVHRARREGEFRGSEGWSLALERWALAKAETSGQVRTNEEVYEGLTTGKGSPRT